MSSDPKMPDDELFAKGPLPEAWERLWDKVKFAQESRVGERGNQFIQRAQKNLPKAMMDELHLNTYDLMQKMAWLCGRMALQLAEVDDDVYGLSKQAKRQEQFMRDLITKAVVESGVVLARKCLEEPTDLGGIRLLASTFLASIEAQEKTTDAPQSMVVSQATTQAPEVPSHVASPVVEAQSQAQE